MNFFLDSVYEDVDVDVDVDVVWAIDQTIVVVDARALLLSLSAYS